MPVSAKLSRKFYETFGDEIANELVNWFNDVDATYRADLRELNELNFQRFEATLKQGLAELEVSTHLADVRLLGTHGPGNRGSAAKALMADG